MRETDRIESLIAAAEGGNGSASGLFYRLLLDSMRPRCIGCGDPVTHLALLEFRGVQSTEFLCQVCAREANGTDFAEVGVATMRICDVPTCTREAKHVVGNARLCERCAIENPRLLV